MAENGEWDDVELNAVHRLAYRARAATLRAQYLSDKLANEQEYNQELYDICEMYEAKFRDDYAEYKNALQAEAFIRHDWEHLTFLQRAAIVIHEPLVTRTGRVLAVLSTIMALASTVALVIETLPQYNPQLHSQNSWGFTMTEVFFTAYFSLETFVGVVAHPRRLQYLRSLSFLTDFVGCLPLYLTFFLGTFVTLQQSLDTLRMVRIFRVLKYTVTLPPVSIMINAIRRSLSILAGPLIFLTCLCFVLAGALYYTTRGTFSSSSGYTSPDCNCQQNAHYVNSSATCPDIKTPISNGIPTDVWWGIVTILTVGFGDIVPECAPGQLIAAFCMIISPIVMAMPIAVLGDTFQEEAGFQADANASKKRNMAIRTLKEHQRTAQLAVSGRLHELSSEKLEAMSRRAGLPTTGQPADMARRLYRLLGLVDPSTGRAGSPRGASVTKDAAPTSDELPNVLTLAEAFIDYLRQRTPFEIIDLARPRPDILLLTDTFFQRVFGWWSRQPNAALAQRLVCSNANALQRIVPLVAVADHSIGVEVEGVEAPDIVLPIPPTSQSTYGPRMATLRVAHNFGALQYILIPSENFLPFVNGKLVMKPTELRDRDVINFGSEEDPLLYTFARLDEFAYSTMATAAMDDKLSTKVWSARQFADTVLAPQAPHRVPPKYDVHPAWEVDSLQDPLLKTTQKEMQFFL